MRNNYNVFPYTQKYGMTWADVQQATTDLVWYDFTGSYNMDELREAAWRLAIRRARTNDWEVSDPLADRARCQGLRLRRATDRHGLRRRVTTADAFYRTHDNVMLWAASKYEQFLTGDSGN